MANWKYRVNVGFCSFAGGLRIPTERPPQRLVEILVYLAEDTELNGGEVATCNEI